MSTCTPSIAVADGNTLSQIGAAQWLGAAAAGVHRMAAQRNSNDGLNLNPWRRSGAEGASLSGLVRWGVESYLRLFPTKQSAQVEDAGPL